MKEIYNDLPVGKQQEFMRNFFETKSFIQEKFGADSLNLEENFYTKQLRNYFDSTIKKRLNIGFDKLENIHKSVDDQLTSYDFDYGINGITKALYDMDEEFVSIYHDFIKNWIGKNIADGRKFWFQKTPTIRVHCPGANSKTVYPAYHNDTFLGHHPYELNIWIPLTYLGNEGHGFDLMDVNESKEILKPYDFDIFKYYAEVRNHSSQAFKVTSEKAKPVTTEFGQILLFDVRSLHSTMPMHQQTRVSMDVRIIFDEDKNNHPFAHTGLGRMKTPFEPGAYYHEKAVQNSSFA
ncbi:MAG: hypothetical protein KGP29_00840 [Proteobacteria bacterium]|nr:hypothetical protein [Pseudomonadota bacterium]